MIDLWCYRRHGHNETDEPTFTQPVMYRQIAEHPTVREIYASKLAESGVADRGEYDRMKQAATSRFDSAQAASKDMAPQQMMPPFGGMWQGFAAAGQDWSAKTQVRPDPRSAWARRPQRFRQGFEVHPKLRKAPAEPKDMSQGKMPIDWGCGEMFALGTLLMEGTPIRFVGQDVQRGTFSHRHACLHDFKTGAKYFPLANLSPDQAPFIIVNTMLSELAVLGFEYGFATADPRNLIVWEGQFGDFVNGAQPVIDQFIAAGETKWRKHCGLVMLLPHGYEGQGPEHSNGYVERFLQLCADNNMQVCMPSRLHNTSICFAGRCFALSGSHWSATRPRASFAAKQPPRLSPTSPIAVSNSSLMIRPIRRAKAFAALLFCTGKVFYTLDAAPQEEQHHRRRHCSGRAALSIAAERAAADHRTLQQRAGDRLGTGGARNRGGWTFMEPRLRPMLPDVAVMSYYGRPEAASPAVGSYHDHVKQEQLFVAHALDLPEIKPPTQKSTSKEAARNATPVSD